MTSIDQAFVKAYARRNQPARAPQEAEASSADDGALQLNDSAAATARVWIDAADGTRRRHDPADAAGRKPHLETASASPSAAPAAPEAASEPPSTATDSAPKSPQAELDGTFFAHATLAPELANLYAEPEVAPTPLRFDPPASDRPRQPTAPQPTAPQPTAPQPDAPQTAAPHEPSAQSATTTSPNESPAAAPQSPEPQSAEAVATTSPQPFRAVWEVDHFETPESVARLFLNSSLFEQIGEQIASAARDGLRSVLVTSTHSGEGRSTAAIGTALAAASTGLAVALVDADARQPTLADDLRLDLEYGWLDAMRGQLPIEEVSVHSIDDHLTLVPLMPPPGSTSTATAAEVDALVRQLRSRFDLVILDGSPIDASGSLAALKAVDTAMVVRDVTRTSDAEVQEAAGRLRARGVQGIGVIENFS